ncbi:MAG: glutaminyl-peptide cyclotransferase [Prolixibacteraceae bacterium]|jgi:glutaminyl-peptide cyclotransferase|nr:glutaminyl-peptide cyclotransferase [Prolixibacteraceae bacterium]
MNFGILSKFLIFAIVVTVVSCSGKPKQSRKPVSQVKIENKQNKLVSGENLLFSVSTKVHNGELDKTEVFINDEQIAIKNELAFSIKIENYKQVGKHTIKVVSTKTDGTVGSSYKSFEVVSDLIPEKYTYKVSNSFPHNIKFFTQGLEFHNGFLFESTGENGTSGIYKVNLKTGQPLQSVNLDEQYFGEGITILNNKIYQLTYKAQKGFIYDLQSFTQTGEFTFESEQGWGMTNDGKNLIMSDGTHILTFLDPISLKPLKKLQVADNKGTVQYLNELEYSDGHIYANIYTTDNIVKIDIFSGKVVAEINLRGILGTYNPNERIDVLNGIAIGPDNKKMYVTGKLWPKLFEIELIKKE